MSDQPGTVRPRGLEDRLWDEHGWALGGAPVAVLVSAILLASAVVRLLG